MRILRLVDSEDASLEELTEVISTDPALTSKVLKFMNSPIVGAGYKGTTLGEAIARIGMRGAKLMALSFSLISKQEDKVCASFDFSRFWSESLARAVAARSLSQASREWNVEDAFITALVCEIGKLVYATGMPAEYEPVLSGRLKPALSLREREHQVLGADRFEIGMCLLKDWQLPEDVWKTVGKLGVGQDSEPGPEERILEDAQSVAEFICNKDQHTAEALDVLSNAVTPALGIDAEEFRTLLKTIGDEWVGYGRLLSVTTETLPDFGEIEKEAEEQLTALRLATEVEVKELRTENQQLSHLARRDRLTGLFNRGAFDAALPEAIDGASNKEGSVALLMIDADHFKSVNDVHGHPAGDAVLRHLARVISDNVRRRDEVFRNGG
jgi:HD-like signal output (HDOD) protein